MYINSATYKMKTGSRIARLTSTAVIYALILRIPLKLFRRQSRAFGVLLVWRNGNILFPSIRQQCLSSLFETARTRGSISSYEMVIPHTNIVSLFNLQNWDSLHQPLKHGTFATNERRPTGLYLSCKLSPSIAQCHH